MTKLSNILNDRLPAVVRTRYAGNSSKFWVNAANDALGELERIGVGPMMWGYDNLPVAADTSLYAIPNSLSSITTVEDSSGNKLEWFPAGDGMIEVATGSLSAGTVRFATYEDFISGYTDTNGSVIRITYDGSINELIGKGFTVVDSDQTRILSGVILGLHSQYTDGDGIVHYLVRTTSGKEPITTYREERSPNLSMEVYDSYITMRGIKKLHRFNTLNSPSPLGAEWDRLIAGGMRFYAEIQTDESTNNAAAWKTMWEEDKRRFASFGSKMLGDYNGVYPRPFSLRRK